MHRFIVPKNDFNSTGTTVPHFRGLLFFRGAGLLNHGKRLGGFRNRYPGKAVEAATVPYVA